MATETCPLARLFPPTTPVLSNPSRSEVSWHRSATRLTDILGTALDASFLHARQQEDIRSSHQLWLRFYSNDLNEIIDRGVQTILGEEVGARVFLGWRGSYHRTPTIVPVVRTPFFAGGDIDMKMGPFYVGGSAQAGLPLAFAATIPNAHYVHPYWELSLRAYQRDPNLFIGAGISPDLVDPEKRFYGTQAVLRI